MSFLFRKKKNVQLKPPNSERENIPLKIPACLKKLQRQWADWMQNKAEQFSARAKLVVLLLFVIISACTSLGLIIASFTHTQSILPVTTITRPSHAIPFDNRLSYPTNTIGKKEYQKVQRFKGYMDSLARSPTGKVLYNHIIAVRPGLIDSIILLEKLYQLQTKK